jgi:hypothetical protein
LICIIAIIAASSVTTTLHVVVTHSIETIALTLLLQLLYRWSMSIFMVHDNRISTIHLRLIILQLSLKLWIINNHVVRDLERCGQNAAARIRAQFIKRKLELAL